MQQKNIQKKHYENIIIGAGVSGIAAGIEFTKNNHDCLILEREDNPGGLCQSVQVGECKFDFGPKILLLDDSKNSQEILSYLGDNYVRYPVVESMYMDKFGILDFPLQRHLYSLPEEEKKKILDDIEKSKKFQREIVNYKDWLINAFGEYFCEKVLFPYEEKKWQIELEKLDYKWALERPIKVDYDEIQSGALTKLPPRHYYYYPKKGSISTLIEGMVKHCGPIICKQNIIQINTKEKYIESKDSKYYYDNLISTTPIDVFLNLSGDNVRNIDNVNSSLQGLGILVVNLVFKGNYDLQGTAIYFPGKEFIFRRVSILQNLCPALFRKGFTPIQVEISIGKQEWNEKEITERILKDFKKVKQFFALGQPMLVNCLRIDLAYPLPNTNLEKCVHSIHQYYENKNVYHCGRGGNYAYCNLDKAYKQGSDLAKKMINNAIC